MIPISKLPTCWPIYLCVLFAALWVSAEIRLKQLRERTESLWTLTVHIQTIKASTGENLSPAIRPQNSDKDHLPIIIQGDATDRPREYIITSDRSVMFGISADGYREQWVKVNRDSPSEIKVRLEEQ